MLVVIFDYGRRLGAQPPCMCYIVICYYWVVLGGFGMFLGGLGWCWVVLICFGVPLGGFELFGGVLVWFGVVLGGFGIRVRERRPF